MRDEIQRWDWKNWSELSRDTLYEILMLRQAIFVVEQECPYLDTDGQDQFAGHVLGRSNQHVLLGYSRVFLPKSDGQSAVIGRVIVHPKVRGQGIGYELMRQSEVLAIAYCDHRIHSFSLSAQAHLQHFYGQLGYEITGPGYDEDGIPHLPMQKKLE